MASYSDILPTIIYLIRNGQAEDSSNRPSGRHDPELDEHGHRQAEGLARMFRKRKLNRIICSPSQRTHQTAAYIADAAGVSLEVEAELADRDYGPWTRLPRSRTESLFGSIDRAPDIERYQAFSQRVNDAMTRIARQAGNSQAVAIVAHQAVNRAIVAHLFPYQFADFSEVPQGPGCWNLLEFSPPYRWKLMAVDLSIPRWRIGRDDMYSQRSA